MTNVEHARRETPPRPLGVLFIDVPPLLASLLQREIDASGAIRVVDVASIAHDSAVGLDAVVLGAPDGIGVERARALLMRWPWVRVLEVVITGEAAALYELQPRRTLLGEIDPGAIIGALLDPGACDWGSLIPGA